jgi:OFA family oxalate/formate antiporter-like MFS transporter
MPAFATDVFGARHAGTIYGAMLTAWSAGAVVGPLVIATIPYRTALLLIAGMLAVAAALPLLFNALVQGWPRLDASGCNQAARPVEILPRSPSH